VRSHDSDVLEFALDACREGEPCWLVTVVAVTGSSPRPRGALLACRADGQQAGSVSGGCVEEDLLQRLRAGDFDQRTARRVKYGVSAEENARLGLPCGGHLDLVVQRLDRADIDWLNAALAAMGERRCVLRQLDLASGNTRLEDSEHFHDLEVDAQTLSQCFGPRYRMLLVGAGQLAASIAELALAMDYDVVVTDPRADTLAQWSGPEVTRLGGMPDDVVREQAVDRFSVVITLTHDPRIDDMALMEALESEAWYVGALGSARTTAKRLDRLRALGIGETGIARLHAPVGLDIGSKTPLEIAVAVMAQLVQLRRRPAAAQAVS
jgi:xanthine dehydrogenase accessory factor